MQRWNNSKYIQAENTDMSLLINNIELFIYEHRYIEFRKRYVTYHYNRVRDNANLLYFIEEGGGYVECGGKTIPLQSGNIYFYPCIKDKKFRSVFLPGTKKVCVGFYLDLFGCEDVFLGLRGVRRIKDEENLISKVKDAVLSDSFSQCMLFPGLLIQSIISVLNEVEGVLSERLMLGKRYRQLFDYIDNNLTYNMTLDMISENTGISHSSLTHTVPNKLGFTIKQYIQRKIMRKICLELSYTDMRIKDISQKYGFESESYFSDWFFKLYEIRPSMYRNIFNERRLEDYCLYSNNSEDKA